MLRPEQPVLVLLFLLYSQAAAPASVYPPSKHKPLFSIIRHTPLRSFSFFVMLYFTGPHNTITFFFFGVFLPDC